ncbi:MAG TPA: type VI secretion system tube protein Hcp [Woeseiaceae bacterium]|nr:type VI secretion system tube protein Hcp [Woeseiaceae bacterium]
MAFDAFLDMGKDVEGESTRKGFEKQIEIYSFSWGVSNPATIGPGSEGAGGGRATLSSFNCMKATDKASPMLFQFCAQGKHFPKVKLSLNKAGGDSVTYLTYEFENCFIESVQWSGSSGGDDRPTESLSIAFGKVTITYNAQAMTGAKDAKAVIGSWDVQKVTA